MTPGRQVPGVPASLCPAPRRPGVPASLCPASRRPGVLMSGVLASWRPLNSTLGGSTRHRHSGRLEHHALGDLDDRLLACFWPLAKFKPKAKPLFHTLSCRKQVGRLEAHSLACRQLELGRRTPGARRPGVIMPGVPASRRRYARRPGVPASLCPASWRPI